MFHRVKSETHSAPEQEQKTTLKVASSDREDTVKTQETGSKEDAKRETHVVSDADTQSKEQSSKTDPKTPEKEADTMSQPAETTRNETQTETAKPAEPSTASYQRAGTAPISNVGGYPGSYPGYGASQPSEASAGDRRLTIGAGITMSGEIEACDYLLVEGTVEAALKGASVLDIAESGIFYGTVEIEDATIAGRFEGDITAHGRLTLREGATVTGSIAYKELEIEAGAVIDGKLTPLQAVQQAAGKKPSAAPKKDEAPVKARAAQANASQGDAQQTPANSDGELFSKAATAAE